MKTAESKLDFETELTEYDARKSELLKGHEGKFAVLKDHEFLGVFDSFEEAYKAGLTKWGIVPMFIQKIERLETVAQIPLLYVG